jgi:hypothetical protein
LTTKRTPLLPARLVSGNELSTIFFNFLRNVVKTSDTGTTTSGLSLFDKDKSEIQKDASAARKMGHNIIK